jgi:opacity protein-like surface antigen
MANTRSFTVAVGIGLAAAFSSGSAAQADGPTVIVPPTLIEPEDESGLYFRFGAGGAALRPVHGRWLPPGYPVDPEVFFDVTGPAAFALTAAVGHDWANGFRGELAVLHVGQRSIDAPFSHSVPVTAGPHADVTASVVTNALMANLFYTPDLGSATFQPFVTAGLGVASNRMAPWTRVNPAATRPVRTFEGANTTSLAWSLGAGVSVDLSNGSSQPVFLDLAYNFFDLGTARGGATPLPGNGSSTPVAPFEYRNINHVFTVSVRIPLSN